MSSSTLNCLMFAALSFAAAPAFSADTGTISANATLRTFVAEDGGYSNKRLSFSFTRSDGSTAWNPGRISLFNADGSKLFELNDLGNVGMTSVSYGVLGAQYEVRMAQLSSTFTVNSQTYVLDFYSWMYVYNGQPVASTRWVGATLSTAPTYDNPYGGTVWTTHGGGVTSLVLDP